MSVIKIPKPSSVLEGDKVSLEALEKIMNYSLHGRLVLEGLLTTQSGIESFRKSLTDVMYNEAILSYIFQIGDIWLNSMRRRRFNQLVLKVLMYPDFEIVNKSHRKTDKMPKSPFTRYQKLWKIMDKWGESSKTKVDGEWRLESCFQEWNKLMYHQKEDPDFWSTHKKYGNFVAKILIYFMNYLQHPLSMYHVLLLDDVTKDSQGNRLRLEMSQFVTKLKTDRESLKSEEKEQYKSLLDSYDSLKKTHETVLRSHYPLQYLVIEDNGNCKLLEWNKPKFTKKKQFFTRKSASTQKNLSERPIEKQLEDSTADDVSQRDNNTETEESEATTVMSPYEPVATPEPSVARPDPATLTQQTPLSPPTE